MQNFVSVFDGTMDSIKGVIRMGLETVSSFLNVFSNFNIGATVIISVFIIMLALGILRNGSDFSKQIKQTKTLAICAMLIAAKVILNYFSIDFTSYLRIGFSFIVTPIAGSLFGPIIGGIVAIISDITAFIIKPTGGFLFTYTLSVGVGGILYGLMLYNKKPTVVRILIANTVVMLVVNIILNSIALAPTAGSGLIGIMPSRIIKNLLQLPIQTVITYIVLKATVHRIK